jgi:hypothetical protein
MQPIALPPGARARRRGVCGSAQGHSVARDAGFVNVAKQNSGSEELTAVARYRSLLAIFPSEVVPVWFVDPNAALNVPRRVLSSTGTSCPQSVTQFGDTDVLYWTIAAFARCGRGTIPMLHRRLTSGCRLTI